jgi:cytoskeletal protein CcmA (bactofilin family)
VPWPVSGVAGMVLDALKRAISSVLGSDGRRPRPRHRPALVGFERLEDRRVLSATPLSIGGLESFIWLDPDGDGVEISVQGTAGELSLVEDNTDAFGNNDGTLEDGENPALLSVTSASGDFRIEARHRTDLGVGDGLVTLGRLEAIDQVFGGFSAESGTASFRLDGLIANGFTDGTGLTLDALTGDLVLRNLSSSSFIDVKRAALGRVVVRDGIEGDIRVGGDLRDDLVIGGDWSVNSTVQIGGNLLGNVQVVGDLRGDLTVDQTWQGRLSVTARLATSAHIIVGQTLLGDVDVVGGFDGVLQVQAVWTGDLKVAGDYGTTAVIRTGGNTIGTATFFDRFWGRVEIGGRAMGTWNAHGVVGGTAQISAGTHFDKFHASGAFFGDISAGGSVTLVVDGHVGSTTLVRGTRAYAHVGGTFYGDATASALLYVKAYQGLTRFTELQAPTVYVVTPGGARGGAAIQTENLNNPNLPPLATTNLLMGQGPFVIRRSGVYTLMNDVTFSAASGDAITVLASNVTIDLNGHSIDGTVGSASAAVGIRAENVSRVTVQNGTVRGFLFGTILIGSEHDVDTVRADSNWYYGLWVEGDGARIRDSFVTATGGSTLGRNYTVVFAARLIGSDSSFIDNMVVVMQRSPYNVELVGLHVDSAPNSTVAGNVFALDDSAQFKTWGLWINGGSVDWHGTTSLVLVENLFTDMQIGAEFSYAAGLVGDNSALRVANPVRLGTSALQSADSSLAVA